MANSLDATQFKFDNAAVPRRYQELLVPRLFLPWAERLLDQAALQAGQTVVDVATGPGTVARLAAKRVGTSGRVIATDVSAPMLAVARSHAGLSGSAPIDYVESGAAPLLVPDAIADMVVCQQGLQFFPDRSAALGEMYRALKPKGRVGVSVWAGIGSCTIWSAYHHALADSGLVDLAQLILAPFSWGSADSLGKALVDAGFSKASVETRSMPMVFEGGVDQAFDGFSGQPVGPAIGDLPEERRKALRAALAARMASLLSAGEVHGQMTAHVAIGEA